MRNDYVSWRRLHGDLIAVFNMFSGGFDLNPSPFFIPPERTGHPFKVLQGPSRRLRRKSSFSIFLNIVNFLNRRPTSTVTNPSANSFKDQLEPAWEELFGEVL